MKFTSIKNIYVNSKESFLRFPLTIISAFVGVAFSIYLIEYEKEIENFFPYVNISLTAALGIPLFFSVSMYCNTEKISLITKYVINVLTIFLLIAIYHSLPDSEFTNNIRIPYIKYGIYNCIVHLLVSFAPYLKTKKINGFWNYNKLLFIRLCKSILYSIFLHLGFVIALYSIDTLFNIKIEDDLYLQIYVFIIGVFNTWFFVAGVPTDIENLEKQKKYPKGLKIFTQYVLLPLLILYLIILYVYGFKIIINWDWPKGIVSSLISGVAILGILVFLLIYPYSNLKENSWIKLFSKSYYYILFPLVILLFFAIGIRVNQYGFTISRYIIIILGIWLSFLCIYFSVGKSNIKIIPQTLAIFLGMMSFGPWGIFSISEKSQSNRLKNILEKAKITTNHKVNNEVIWNLDSLPKLYSKKLKTNQYLIKDSIYNEIHSIINYLENHHGFKSIQPLFKQNMDSIISIASSKKKYFNETEAYMQSLGLEKYTIYKEKKFGTNFYFSSPHKELTEVNDYDFFVNVKFYENDKKPKKYQAKNYEFYVAPIDSIKKIIMINTNKEKITLDINPLINKLIKMYGNETKFNIDRKILTLHKKTDFIDLKIEIDYMNLDKKNDSIYLKNLDFILFIKEKSNY